MNASFRLIAARQLVNRLQERRRKGFTLIELLVVVVIIGILASVALPSFVGAQDKARNAGVQANVNTVRMGLEQYSTDNNGSYPSGTIGSGSALMTNNYLPGNALPRSPWCKGPQTSGLGAAGSPFISAASIAAGSPLPALNTSAALIASSGGIAEPPSTSSHYGALEYDLDGPSQTYVVYSTGKKSKAAIVAAQVSNGGN